MPDALSPGEALSRVGTLLQPGGDSSYFSYHEQRFRYHLDSLAELGLGGRVLDIGSHYLHFAAAIKLLGADVTALDVAAFQRMPFVANRAAQLKIQPAVVDDLGAGDFLPDAPDGSYDLVLFCEILEHITFNPVRFWRRVHQLLRPGGAIYITTPNATRLWNLLNTFKRALFLEGVGIPVHAIFDNVTYGHHWKEFSAREIVLYFAQLSPDFRVEVRPYAYSHPDPRRSGLKGLPWRVVRRAGNVFPLLRENLEVIVRIPEKTAWLVEPKRYED